MAQPTIRHEVFFREDIRNLLRAIDSANAALAVHLPTSQVAIYRAGFVAALQAVALALDVRLDIRAPHPILDVTTGAVVPPDGG